MHVAVRRYSADPVIFQDLKERLEADFVPYIRQLEGFISYYAVKTGEGSLDTISVFETRESEIESTRLAADFVKRNYDNLRVERIGVDEGPCLVERHAKVPA
jgi:hypothetical protein